MESNNPTLGSDTLSEEVLSATEQTTATAQDNPMTPEPMADVLPTDEVLPEADQTVLPEEEEDVVAAVEEDVDGGENDSDNQAAESGEDETQRLRRGMMVTGTVIETSPTEVLIDLGEGVTGVIASRELERMDRATLETLGLGTSVTAFVIKAKDSSGRPVLSLARAEEENNWQLAETYFHNQQVYFSKVAGYNKGGLIVRFGKVRGFVPASQISRERQRRAEGDSPEARWGNMVGEDIAIKVVEIDRTRNRLILSERAAAREWREQQKGRLLEQLQVGEVRTGRVISVADFGAFVDLGGADGLVHLTEISWQHVAHPRDALQVGQTVKVQVISIDRERKRIGLSMKRLEMDPWQAMASQYRVGQLVRATVTKLTKFGAFARLLDAPEIEGLVHISELADYRVNHPREVVLVGDVLTLRIVKIDGEQRRLGLSLRQVDSVKFMDQDWPEELDETLGGSSSDAPTVDSGAAPETPDDNA